MVLPWLFTALSIVVAAVAVGITLLNHPQMTNPYDYDETPYQYPRRRSPPPPYSRTPPMTPPQPVTRPAEEDKKRETTAKKTEADEERQKQESEQKEKENSICTLCSKKMLPSDERWSLTCAHRFHETCLQKKLYKQIEERCPICNEKLTHRRYDVKPELVVD